MMSMHAGLLAFRTHNQLCRNALSLNMHPGIVCPAGTDWASDASLCAESHLLVGVDGSA